MALNRFPRDSCKQYLLSSLRILLYTKFPEIYPVALWIETRMSNTDQGGLAEAASTSAGKFYSGN